METEVQTKPQEPVAIGMEQEHTVGIEVTVIEHKDLGWSTLKIVMSCQLQICKC